MLLELLFAVFIAMQLRMLSGNEHAWRDSGRWGRKLPLNEDVLVVCEGIAGHQPFGLEIALNPGHGV
eukprot:COSAG02_NODE_27604_length_606_cov_0.897436_1_plen_66_part_10